MVMDVPSRTAALRNNAHGQHLGYEKSAAWILLKRVDMDGSSNGRKPASSTYRITPMDQTSAMRPS